MPGLLLRVATVTSLGYERQYRHVATDVETSSLARRERKALVQLNSFCGPTYKNYSCHMKMMTRCKLQQCLMVHTSTAQQQLRMQLVAQVFLHR